MTRIKTSKGAILELEKGKLQNALDDLSSFCNYEDSDS